MFSILTAALLGIAAPSSDVDLKGGVLDEFLVTKGRSQLGRSVHWHVPAKALIKPHRDGGGGLLFIHKKIGILTSSRSSELDEIRRRGKIACLRGRVCRTPEKGRKKGDPELYIQVRQLRHRKR